MADSDFDRRVPTYTRTVRGSSEHSPSSKARDLFNHSQTPTEFSKSIRWTLPRAKTVSSEQTPSHAQSVGSSSGNGTARAAVQHGASVSVTHGLRARCVRTRGPGVYKCATRGRLGECGVLRSRVTSANAVKASSRTSSRPRSNPNGLICARASTPRQERAGESHFVHLLVTQPFPVRCGRSIVQTTRTLSCGSPEHSPSSKARHRLNHAQNPTVADARNAREDGLLHGNHLTHFHLKAACDGEFSSGFDRVVRVS